MRIYSVTEFRQEINDLLGQITVVIQGEVSDFSISQGRFVWFTVKDEQTSVKCFMMSFHLKVPIEDGMEVQLMGSPTMFKKGQFVFRPRRVELVGDGSLQRAFEILKGKLEAEGLFDEHRKRELPRFPHRIGLVTSRDAAAYTDVLRILRNRWPSLEIILAHVNVQGANAVNSIVDGLAQLNEEHPELDCIILTRGGGSLEDLQAFNEEEVVRAIFASQLPVVSGVGHERDTTLADLVADVRASTPSNAAELVAPNREDILGEIEYLQERLEQHVRDQIRTKQDAIDNTVRVLEGRARAQVDAVNQLRHKVQLHFERFQEQLQTRQTSIIAMERLLTSLHPSKLLAKGYTYTLDSNGKVITSVKKLKKGQSVQVQFADGTAETSVQRVHSDN